MTTKGITGTHNVVTGTSPSRYHGTHKVVLVHVTDPDPVKATAQLAAIVARIEAGLYPPQTADISGMVYDFVSAHMDGRRIVGVVQLRVPDGVGRLPYRRGKKKEGK